MTTDKAPGIPIPEEKDYHGHPNYTKVVIGLMILFAISLVVGYLTSPLIAVLLVFLTAIIKAGLVAANFMHLKFEAKLIWVAVGAFVFIVLAFFWGVFPDITIVPRELVK